MINAKSLALGATFAMSFAVPAVADGDAAAGQRVFNRCKACHAVGEDARNKVGPVLNGVVDATAGLAPDFSYSDEMVAAGAGGLVWDTDTLTSFLTDPSALVPGTKMSFAGLRREGDIADVIAYLGTFE